MEHGGTSKNCDGVVGVCPIGKESLGSALIMVGGSMGFHQQHVGVGTTGSDKYFLTRGS